jgi:hypothetical protein
MKSPVSLQGDIRFYTSADPEALKSLLPVLLGEGEEVEKVKWLNDSVIARL